MTIDPSRRLLLLFTIVACILLAGRLVAGLDALRGAAARNAGFLAFNESGATPGNGTQPARDHLARGVSRLTQATALAPDNESAWRALGYLHLAAGAEAEALSAWKQSDAVAAELLGRGQTSEAAGRTAEALRWYERATIIDPELVEGWLRIGNRHEVAGDWQAAEATYSAGLVATPDSGDLLFHLGRLRARSANGADWPAILSITEFALAQDEYEHAWNRAQTHFLRGEALRGLGRQLEALAEYTTVVTEYPNDYWATLRRAEMYWDTGGEPAAAENFFRSAISLDPESKWAYHYLGRFYAATSRPVEARAQFERALEIDPADPVALEWLSSQ